MTQPLTDEQLAAIQAQFERTTHPNWRAETDIGRLLAEVHRLRTENAGLNDLRLRAIDKGEKLRAERDAARAQIAAARAAAHIADSDDVTDWQRGYRSCSTNVLAALDAADPTTT